MDAPDELRQVLADAMAKADEAQEFTYPELADAVLAVPAIADALRDAEMLAAVRRVLADTTVNDEWKPDVIRALLNEREDA